jgi:predicted ABC-type ATPase
LSKKCYIISGPNGAGKTTFAYEFLPIEAECLNFINADLIAQGLSPFQPETMGIEAGRLMIHHIDECTRKNESFAFETTLSGKRYRKKINEWKSQGYEIIIYYLKLSSVDIAIERVKLRVMQGGHNVPEKDIRRRFVRSWDNFETYFKSLADSWVIFDMSGTEPTIVDRSEEKDEKR